MKFIKFLIFMGFFGSLFNCNYKKTNIEKGELKQLNQRSPDFYVPKLSDLNKNQKDKFSEDLKKSEKLIRKYSQKTNDIFNSENLDIVLKKWKLDTDSNKECQKEIVELIGCAFGQYLINELDCEWQVLTDNYGTSFIVVNKKYNVNGFPFSSVLEVIKGNGEESLNEIKLIIKDNIIFEKEENDYRERK